MTVSQSSLISLTHHCYDWYPGSRCGWTCNQLTSKVDGGITRSRLRWSTLIWCATADPTIPLPCLDLPQQQWSLLNHFCTEQGHIGACRRKWRLAETNLCPCGETQTMSHIDESCPLTKLNGGLSLLHYMLFHGWPVMVHDTHTRRRRLCSNAIWLCFQEPWTLCDSQYTQRLRQWVL